MGFPGAVVNDEHFDWCNERQPNGCANERREQVLVSWLTASVFVVAVAIALTFVPLFNTLGFEFSVTLGAVLAYVSGWRACRAAWDARETWVAHPDDATGGRFPAAAMLRLAASNLALCLFPLAVISVNALRVATCNWNEGLRFYALFTLPGILYGSALGFAMGLRFSPRWARLLFVLWSLATYVWALWNVVREPPIFAYNAFIGFFPGPVYDRLIPISERLVLARGIVVLQALLFVLVAALLWDGHRLRLRALFFPWNGIRGTNGALALVLVVILGLVWGHASELGLRVDRATIHRELGGFMRTEHCDIYYDVGAYPPARAAELAREHEFHYQELHDFFGFEPAARVGSYVYASPEQKKRLMGAAGTNFEDALNDEFHINAATYPHPVLRHEMAHIFAAHFSSWWPICPLIGVHEGIAVAAEWRGESARLGLTPDEACVGMDSLGVLPDLRRAMSALGFWSQSSRRVYTAAGSFVHYLVERHGMPTFRALWTQRDFTAVYGRDLDALLADWRRERLDSIVLTAAQLRRAEQLFRPPAIFAVPCAHEQARLRVEAARALGRWSLDEADSLYGALVEISDGDVQYRLWRAEVHMRAGRFTTARQALVELLDAPDLHGSLRGRALDRLGDAEWNAGAREEAERAYAEALAWTATRQQSRAVHVARAAMADSVLEPLLREYLSEIVPNEAGLALLARALGERPDAALPRYLMGRRLYFAERFDEAVEFLGELPAAPSLPEDARLASLELLAWAELRRGVPGAARRAAAASAAFRLDAAERLLFADIAARASWLEATRANAADPPKARAGVTAPPGPARAP